MEDSLVETRIRSACEETVQLHKEKEVGILALRGCSVAFLYVVSCDIDTHLDY